MAFRKLQISEPTQGQPAAGPGFRPLTDTLIAKGRLPNIGQPPEQPSGINSFADKTLGNAFNFGVGAAKGAASTIQGISKIGQKALTAVGVAKPTDTNLLNTPNMNQALERHGTAQKIGYGAEKLTEFVAGSGAAVPLKAAPAATLGGKVATVAARSLGQGAAAGTVAAAQGADKKEIGKAAILSAIFSAPFEAYSQFAPQISGALKASAQKKASQALGATTKENKAISEKLVPEILNKKVTFLSRGGGIKKAANQADDLGQQIDDAWASLPDDTRTAIEPAIKQLEQAKDALSVSIKNGTRMVPDAAKSQYQALQNIQDEILSFAKMQDNELPGAIHIIKNHADEAIDVLKEYADESAQPFKNIPLDKITGRRFAEGTPELIRGQLEEAAKTGTKLAEGAHHGATLGRKIDAPILLSKNLDDTYNIVDGNHRAVQALINGDKTIPAVVQGADDIADITPQVLKRIKDNAVAALEKGVTGDPGKYGKFVQNVKNADISTAQTPDDVLKILSDAANNAPESVSAKTLRSYKQIMDGVIKKSKSGFGLTGDETAKLAAQKEGANAIRNILNTDHPNIAKLNKEFNFWSNLEKVLSDTSRRTASQGSLGEDVAEGAGVVAGVVAKGTLPKALLIGSGARLLKRAVSSPGWRVTSAVARNEIADALISGNAKLLSSLLNRVLTAGVSAQKE